MDNVCNNIMAIGGIVFLAYAITASAYWQEMTRLGSYLQKTDDENLRTSLLKQIRISQIIFRSCTAMMILAIVIVLTPVYFQNPAVCAICRYVLLVPIVGIVFMSIRYTAGKYYIDYMPKA